MRPNDQYQLGVERFQTNFWQKGFLTMLALLLAVLITSMVRKQEAVNLNDRSTAGDIEVTVHWPGCRAYQQDSDVLPKPCTDRVDVDVDVWLLSPDDEVPTGYSHRTGRTWSLLRDDLGTSNDKTDRNYENAFARGAPSGDYVVNVKLFKVRDGRTPEVPVEVRVTKRHQDGRMEPLATGGIADNEGVFRVTLRQEEEEVTVVRFRLDEKGALVPDSVNNIPMELSTWKAPFDFSPRTQ